MTFLRAGGPLFDGGLAIALWRSLKFVAKGKGEKEKIITRAISHYHLCKFVSIKSDCLNARSEEEENNLIEGRTTVCRQKFRLCINENEGNGRFAVITIKETVRRFQGGKA